MRSLAAASPFEGDFAGDFGAGVDIVESSRAMERRAASVSDSESV